MQIANVRVGYVQSVELADAQHATTGLSKLVIATLKLDGERPVNKKAAGHRVDIRTLRALAPALPPLLASRQLATTA